MEGDFQHLAWDSEFFGFPVARISLDQASRERLPLTLDSLRKAGFRLAYWFMPHECGAVHDALSRGGVLADEKITFHKTLSPSSGSSHSVYRAVPYGKAEASSQLLSLALQSGEHSRFKVDPGFAPGSYEKLYGRWMTRSVAKEIASEVLVVAEGEALLGMVTLGAKGERGDIGLLAVSEGARGRGVGRVLVEEADAFFAGRGFAEAQVVTQRRNVGACKLYHSCGYREERAEDVFHFWL